jgi:hypothetical protein
MHRGTRVKRLVAALPRRGGNVGAKPLQPVPGPAAAAERWVRLIDSRNRLAMLQPSSPAACLGLVTRSGTRPVDFGALASRIAARAREAFGHPFPHMRSCCLRIWDWTAMRSTPRSRGTVADASPTCSTARPCPPAQRRLVAIGFGSWRTGHRRMAVIPRNHM